MEVHNYVGSSGMKSETHKITWKVEDFDVVRSSSEFISSQQLTFEAGKSIDLPTTWAFYLEEFKKEGEKEKVSIGVYLKLVDSPGASLAEATAKYQMRILMPDRKSIFKATTCGVRKFDTKGKEWGFTQVIAKDAKLETLPLVDGCLIMEFEVSIYVPTGGSVGALTRKTLKATEDQYLAKFAKTLQQDLASYLENASSATGNESRSKIISRDKKEFSVHRGMLAARSPVFATMFLKESKTGIIHTPDLSSKTVAVLLRFLYTGTLHEDWSTSEVIVELVYAAEKYQLQDLLEFLDLALGSVCTKETVGKLSNLATKLSLKTAEKELFEYMKTHLTSIEDMLSFAKDTSAVDIIQT